MMTRTIPYIVERFPQHSERILRERFRHTEVKDLCEDYETVIDALGTLHAQAGQIEISTEDYRHLSQLKLELEREILQWLANHPQG